MKTGLLLMVALACRLVSAEVVPSRDLAREAELDDYVAWLQRESGWFTIRHPDPLAATRTESVDRIREDLARVLTANEHLLPARKPILMATLLDPTLPDTVRFSLAVFLANYHAVLRLDRDQRLCAEGIVHRLRAYDYSRALSQLTMTILREFSGQPASAVIPALRAAGWMAADDDVVYVVETVVPTLRVR